MLTLNDVIDLVVKHLSVSMDRMRPAGLGSVERSGGSYEEKAVARPFLSEYEIRKRLTAQSRQLTIPKNAILSPLAEEWLCLKGIKVIRE